MDKNALVTVDVALGEEVVDALDAAGVVLGVAVWAYLDEYGDWRLVVASRQFDDLGIRGGYGLLHKALDKAGLTPERRPTVMIQPMNNPFIRSLRKMYGKNKYVERMRLRRETIGDRYVEDAYVYRIQ